MLRSYTLLPCGTEWYICCQTTDVEALQLTAAGYSTYKRTRVKIKELVLSRHIEIENKFESKFNMI